MRLKTTRATLPFICAFALSCLSVTGCLRSTAIEAQGDILRANPVYLEGGATVQPLDSEGVQYIFRTPVYVLPESAYKALMLTE